METLNPESHKEGFEEQFAKKEKFNVLDGQIEAVDVSSEDLKTEVPLLVALGWASTPENWKDSIETMYEKNRRTLSLFHAREGISADLMDPELKKQYPVAELRKALALLKIIDEKNIEKVDVVAHSEGAANTAIAACMYPEKFRKILFVEPAGLMGKDSFLGFALRFIKNTIKENKENAETKDPLHKMRAERGGKEFEKYLGQNRLRALQEAVAMSKMQIQDMLKYLHDKGISIAIMHGVDDPGFPMEKIQKVVKSGWIDGFVSVKGGHNEIINHPEQYMSAADELLDKMPEQETVK